MHTLEYKSIIIYNNEKIELKTIRYDTKNCFNGSLQRLYTRARMDGSEKSRALSIRQMGKHQRIFRQAKGYGLDEYVE